MSAGDDPPRGLRRRQHLRPTRCRGGSAAGVDGRGEPDTRWWSNVEWLERSRASACTRVSSCACVRPCHGSRRLSCCSCSCSCSSSCRCACNRGCACSRGPGDGHVDLGSTADESGWKCVDRFGRVSHLLRNRSRQLFAVSPGEQSVDAHVFDSEPVDRHVLHGGHRSRREQQRKSALR